MLIGRVQITKSLHEEPRRLVPKGVDVTGTVIDPKLKPNGGSIRLPCPVVTYGGRETLFGNEEPGRYDYTVAPHKYQTRRILVPYIENFEVVADRPVLNMVLFRADNIVRIAQRVQAGEAQPEDLQVSVNRYFDEIECQLCGKNGLLTRDMFGFRCRNSVRGVAAPDPDLTYEEVGVPRTAASLAGIENDDWVLLSRSPVLWQGSVLVLRARIVDGTAVLANPFVMAGLGLDFDGDELSVIKVPAALNPELAPELRAAVGDPTIDVFEWADEFLVYNTEPEANWDQIDLDLATRLTPTGLSVGLEDVLDPENSEFFQSAARAAKSLPEDTAKYADGLEVKEWAVEAESAAVEICKLKLQIGLLGSITDKLNQVLIAFAPDHLRSGLEIKERLTDLMMKATKRGTDTGYRTSKIIDLFDRRGKFADASPEKAAEYLASIGFEIPKIKPIIELVYDLGGVSNAVDNHIPLLQVCRGKNRAALIQVLGGNWGFGSIAARIHEYKEGAYGDGGLIPYPRIQAAGYEDEFGGGPL